MPGIDMSRLSEGVTLRPEVARDVWAEALEDSSVARLVPHMTLPGSGITIDTVTSEPEAEWVGETEEKPVGKHGFGVKQMTPYKMALIELYSDEFKRDKAALYNEISRRLPKALGRLLDRTVLYGTAPGSNFDVLSDAPLYTLGTGATIGRDILAINRQIAASGASLSGWALSPQGEAEMIGATGPGGALIFTQDFRSEINMSRILGKPVSIAKAMYREAGANPATTPELVGLAGDFSQARLGIVQSVKMKATTEATVNVDGDQINLWQRNMFGLLVEMEVGFIVNDKNAFVRIGGPVVDADEGEDLGEDEEPIEP